MNVSGIENYIPFSFNMQDRDDPSGSAPAAMGDVINVSMPSLLSDEEAENVLAETMQMISQSPVDALGVHSGLTPERTFALLGLA